MFSDQVHALGVVGEPAPVIRVCQPDECTGTFGGRQRLEVDDAVFGGDIVGVVAGRGDRSRQPGNDLADGAAAWSMRARSPICRPARRTTRARSPVGHRRR